MKVSEIMSRQVIGISPDETVEVAARQLSHYNIGALPVCDSEGKVCGLVTDRDLVTRCLAANRSPAQTKVREIMTNQVISVKPDMQTADAAQLMGMRQVRRLPVTQDGKICGMLSLGDLASAEECTEEATNALSDITHNISTR